MAHRTQTGRRLHPHDTRQNSVLGLRKFNARPGLASPFVFVAPVQQLMPVVVGKDASASLVGFLVGGLRVGGAGTVGSPKTAVTRVGWAGRRLSPAGDDLMRSPEARGAPPAPLDKLRPRDVYNHGEREGSGDSFHATPAHPIFMATDCTDSANRGRRRPGWAAAPGYWLKGVHAPGGSLREGWLSLPNLNAGNPRFGFRHDAE